MRKFCALVNNLIINTLVLQIWSWWWQGKKKSHPQSMVNKMEFNAVHNWSKNKIIYRICLSHQRNEAKVVTCVELVYFLEIKKYTWWGGHIGIFLFNFVVEKYKLLDKNRPISTKNIFWSRTKRSNLMVDLMTLFIGLKSPYFMLGGL